MIQILQELALLSRLNHIHSVVIITIFVQKCDANRPFSGHRGRQLFEGHANRLFSSPRQV